jgi:sugar phosphate permease
MRYGVLSFLCLATVIAYVQRSALGVPSKKIETELGLDPSDMGLVWFGWYASYAVFQLPSGWLAERLGSKSALILSAVVWSLVTGLVGLATGLSELILLWSIMGGAQAGMFPCATRAIGATFSRTEQAFASGCLACSMALGAALAQKLTGLLLGMLSWQEILALYAAPGLLWALAYGIIIPRPDAPLVVNRAADRIRTPWSRLFTNPHMILLCTQQLMRAGATALFFTWFPRYLQETRGVSEVESGGLAAWPLVAGMAGGLIGGLVSDSLLKLTGNARLSRQGLAFAAMVICAGVSVSAFWISDPTVAVGLISIAAFCGYVGGVNAYALAISMGGKRVAPVFATMNMSGNIGASLFPYAVGWLVKATGNWNLALLLFAAMYAASGLCWLFLNPKGTLFDEEPT